MIDYMAEAKRLEPQLIDIRRDFHRHPELGRRESRTAARIEDILRGAGIETRRAADTGVIGVLKCGKPGRTAAFRADIDALPVTEATGLSYASETDGLMHACGHDIHTAALLGAALILGRNREQLHGTMAFVFQPDEEGDGGAERILKSGVLQELGVESIYGAHTAPELPAGTIGVKYGRFYASAGKFDVTVCGQGTHGAEPENGTDSLYAAARMCTELKQLTGDPADGDHRAVCTVGMFRAGEVRNIISDQAYFEGILRTAGPELREIKKTAIREIVRRIAEEERVEADLKLVDGYVGVTNHNTETRLVQDTAESLLGPAHVTVEDRVLMTTEDFGFYLEKYPGAYYHIGVGSPYPLHSPKYCPDESGIAPAAAVHAAVLTKASISAPDL